jgi:hypothetical protein
MDSGVREIGVRGDNGDDDDDDEEEDVNDDDRLGITAFNAMGCCNMVALPGQPRLTARYNGYPTTNPPLEKKSMNDLLFN